MRHRQGFTLIELVVALAVVAIALAAVQRTMSAAVDRARELKLRLLAGWVAENRLAELRVARALPLAGELSGDETQAGIVFRWRVRLGDTPNARMRRIEVEVRARHGAGDVLARRVGYQAPP